MPLTRRVHYVIASPVGNLTVVSSDGTLSALYLPDHRHQPDPRTFGLRSTIGFEEIATQLGEYFAGTRSGFTVPVVPAGTPFQQSVWRKLQEIPYGEVRSYGQVASEFGNRSLGRAVGAANGRNPVSIVIPCHRLVGSDGSLTGYGGGLPAKRFLLELEMAHREQEVAAAKSKRAPLQMFS